MKQKLLVLTAWLIFNLMIGLFLSVNIGGIVTVRAQDLTPPIITIISPEDTTYFTTSVDLNFIINEETDWIGYSLDGTTNISISGNITLSGLSIGSHNVAVYANDTALNTGTATVDFNIFFIDFTAPIITVISPEEGVIYTKKMLN